MALLDISIAQPSVQSHLGTLRSQPLIHGKILDKYTCGNEKISAVSPWKSLCTQKVKLVNFEAVSGHRRGSFLIKAVAIMEANSLVETKDGHEDFVYQQHRVESCPGVIKLQFATNGSEELSEIEQLRRKRISNANKGRTPWNKGKKQSAETRQRIRERTKLPMKDPKVRMKSVNLGHPHSKEMRVKNGTVVQMRWQNHSQRLMVQDLCYYEWQNLVAEASRKGCVGEEELQWDSYKTMEQDLKLEWLESSERRKNMCRPKGSKRAPMSPEHKRKISLAVSAKWADLEYRERVCSALAKYHGMSDGAERKPPRRRKSDSSESTRRSRANKKAVDARDSVGSETGTKNSNTEPKTSKMPLYKDPLVNSKLKMIKKIRAHRKAAETRQNEAIRRAKLLIAEAENAAKALEVAALRSPLAGSALAEARKLIAEAIKSVDSTETGHIGFHENSGSPIPAPLGFVNNVEGEAHTGKGTKVWTGRAHESSVVDGVQPRSQIINDKKVSLGSCNFWSLLNEEVIETSSFRDYGLPESDLRDLITEQSVSDSASSTEQAAQHLSNDNANVSCEKAEAGSNGAGRFKPPIKEGASSNNPLATTKKWVRGRLVEVAESEGQGL